MSHMMCRNHFIHSWTSHGSHICFGVCIASHDTIKCGKMWNRILLHSHGIHIHMGLMNALSHGFTSKPGLSLKFK